MSREIHFNGRKPSKAQVMKHVRILVKEGWEHIEVFWGENWIELEKMQGDWYGSGWIRDISGQDIARFDLNERRAA
jgi:hypothetical protein